jgi:hypothetical protein
MRLRTDQDIRIDYLRQAAQNLSKSLRRELACSAGTAGIVDQFFFFSRRISAILCHDEAGGHGSQDWWSWVPSEPLLLAALLLLDHLLEPGICFLRRSAGLASFARQDGLGAIEA